jgi:uncharacterized membrane protein YfcA
MTELAAVAVLALGALVHGALGFGFPLVTTPLLVLFLDVHAAVLLTLVPTIVTNLASIAGERHWREALRRFLPIPVGTAVGSVIGTKVLLGIDPEPVRILLALVIMGYLILDRSPTEGPERPVPAAGLAALGLVMGLMAGLVNVFSPIVVLFALLTRMRATLMVAAFNLSFLTSKGGQLAAFTAAGAADGAVLTLSLLALPAVLAALWWGMRLRQGLDARRYRRWLRIGLWVTAGMLMVQGVWGLA